MTEQEIKDLKSAEAVKALARAYRDVFSGDQAKLVLWDLEKACSVNESTAKTSPIDPYDVMKKEGMRCAYLRIMNMIQKGREQ